MSSPRRTEVSVNPYAAARLAYTEASIMTASPERLVVMLYDGAIRFLRQSAAALRAGERAQARDRLQRAQAVIDELNNSLDMSQGEVAANLRNIYLFCSRHLIDSTLNADADGYERVAELLSGLRESWHEVANSAEAA
jgi:flagellar protein FliS